MFATRRKECISRLTWSSNGIPDPEFWEVFPWWGDHLVALDCWMYDNLVNTEQNVNWRWVKLAERSSSDGRQAEAIDHRVEAWLNLSDSYAELPKPSGAGALKGGIRLIFCDRPNMTPGLSMSERAFKAVEAKFNLHPATLPALCHSNGSFAHFVVRDSHRQTQQLQMVVKVHQKVEIANYVLSMSHDIQTGWTTAMICGHGAVRPRSCDDYFGSQLHQLRKAITSSPKLWANPLFLPTILLQNYADRVDLRERATQEDIINVENTLGVTEAGGAWQQQHRPRWPNDIDFKQLTTTIHSVSTQIIFMKTTVCRWLQQYAQYLLELHGSLIKDKQWSQHRESFHELLETTRFTCSWVEGLNAGFTQLEDRANLQVNVLFNIITQQANLLNQQESHLNTSIARSSKQDSISMATFTFITALFLPGSFLASLMGMSMFEWRARADNSDGQAVNETVSENFWLYWAIALPLTLCTLLGWFGWYRFANAKFQQEMQKALLDNQHSVASPPDDEKKQSQPQQPTFDSELMSHYELVRLQQQRHESDLVDRKMKARSTAHLQPFAHAFPDEAADFQLSTQSDQSYTEALLKQVHNTEQSPEDQTRTLAELTTAARSRRIGPKRMQTRLLPREIPQPVGDVSESTTPHAAVQHAVPGQTISHPPARFQDTDNPNEFTIGWLDGFKRRRDDTRSQPSVSETVRRIRDPEAHDAV